MTDRPAQNGDEDQFREYPPVFRKLDRFGDGSFRPYLPESCLSATDPMSALPEKLNKFRVTDCAAESDELLSFLERITGSQLPIPDIPVGAKFFQAALGGHAPNRCRPNPDRNASRQLPA